MGARIVNSLTGEAAIESGGQTYGVVFDLAAVMNLEAALGRSVIDIIRQAGGVRDCVAMIIAGADGYARRNPGAKRVNPTLAQRIFADGGGLRLAPVLIESLTCAEGLGLSDGGDEEDGEAGESDPLPPPPS